MARASVMPVIVWTQIRGNIVFPSVLICHVAYIKYVLHRENVSAAVDINGLSLWVANLFVSHIVGMVAVWLRMNVNVSPDTLKGMEGIYAKLSVIRMYVKHVYYYEL